MSRNRAHDRTHYVGDSCDGGHAESAFPVPPCRCGHSRSYHRLIADEFRGCFASPMQAPPCTCPTYTPKETADGQQPPA